MTTLNDIKVSVCIPVFNSKDFIAESVGSVVGQTYKNLEVLIQDNASIDGTWDIIYDLAQKDPRISAERNPYNIGMASNWNKVVSRASGDFIILLSADDFLMSDFLEKCLDVFSRYPDVDIVSCNHLILDGYRTRKRKIIIREGIYTKFSGLVMMLNPFSINFSLFSRKTVEDISLNGDLFNNKYFTCDYDLWYRLSEKGKKIFYLNEHLGVYRWHNGNISKKKERMTRQAFLVIMAHKKKFGFFLKLLLKFTILRFALRVFINSIGKFSLDTRLLRILVSEFFCRF